MPKTSRTLQTLLAGLWILVLAAPAAAAPMDSTVLGSDGELYRVDSAVSESENPFLALHIQRPDGTTEMVTVPGTEGFGVESSPYLHYENASKTLFVTWEERFNFIHARIWLIGYRQGGWSEAIEVAEDPFALKRESRLTATHDSFVVPLPAGGEISVVRTVLHVVWVQERFDGQFVAYAPVTLINGFYVGHHEIFDIASMVQTEQPQLVDLWQTAVPVVAAGDTDHSVIIGFVDPDSGRVASVRVTMLAGELSMLADELRSHLIDFGAQYDRQTPDGLRRLGDELRSHLIDFGHRLDPQILRSIAEDLRSHLIDFGAQYEPTEIRRLATDLRSHLIDFGFRVEDRGLRRTTADQSSPETIDFEANVDATGELRPVAQVAQLRVVKTWALPAEATPQSVLLLSRSGGEALLAWEHEGTLYYRETAKGEWGPVLHLPSGGALGSDEKLTVLKNRVRNR